LSFARHSPVFETRYFVNELGEVNCNIRSIQGGDDNDTADPAVRPGHLLPINALCELAKRLLSNPFPSASNPAIVSNVDPAIGVAEKRAGAVAIYARQRGVHLDGDRQGRFF